MVHQGEIEFTGLTRANAEALLAAAEKVGADPAVVRSTSTGFVVPQEVADAVGPREGEEYPAPEDVKVVEGVKDTPDEAEKPRGGKRGRASARSDKD